MRRIRFLGAPTLQACRPETNNFADEDGTLTILDNNAAISRSRNVFAGLHDEVEFDCNADPHWCSFTI